MAFPTAACDEVAAIILNHHVPRDYFFMPTTPQESAAYVTINAFGTPVTFRYGESSQYNRPSITYGVKFAESIFYTISLKNVSQAGPAAGRRAMAAAMRHLGRVNVRFVEIDAMLYVG